LNLACLGGQRRKRLDRHMAWALRRVSLPHMSPGTGLAAGSSSRVSRQGHCGGAREGWRGSIAAGVMG